MEYTSHTEESRREMLAVIGVRHLEDLFAAIPADVRQKSPLRLPEGLSEAGVDSLLQSLAARNSTPPGLISFLGGGVYDHYVPAAVDFVSSRSEFYTAYTPYQPEVAQGTLQATYEFQSMIRRLTGMEVAQASLYDVGSALAEAALVAMAHTGRHKLVLAGTLNPRFRSVLETYLSAQGAQIETAVGNDGRTDFSKLGVLLNDQTAAVIMSSPNYHGSLERWDEGAAMAHRHGALLIAVFYPISLGLIKSPGECGADIAVGEGQSLGNPPSFGGPLLGLFAARKEFIRRLPGRLIGRSVDALGQTAYVMTLQTREQHIRREKATSNICTAQALLATRAAIYMALLGKQGIARLAQTCSDRAHYLASRIARLKGFSIPFGTAFFNEFVVESPVAARIILDRLRRRGILGGIELGGRFPGFDNRFLVSVTEKHAPDVLDKFVEELRSVSSEGFSNSPAVEASFAGRDITASDRR
jgi:glycine dehydrogenase subunit 1